MRFTHALIAAALAIVSTGSAQPTAPQKLLWQKTPTIEDLRRVYPAQAFQKGVGGGAMLGCDVATDGELLHCKAYAEQPENMGFGVAAVKLAASFRLQPGAFGLRVPGHIAMPMVFGAPGRPMPKLAFRLGDTAMLLTNADLPRDASAPSHLGCIAAESASRCQIHFLTWAARPNAMAALASTLDAGADHGGDLLVCWVKPDGGLTDCQASSNPARVIANDLASGFKAPRFTDDGTPTGAGPIMIALSWAPLSSAAQAMKPAPTAGPSS